MKPIIITLTGASASGKDTLLNELIWTENFKPIISTTSRPMRNGEVQGREYNFVTYEEAINITDNDEFIEKRIYDVANGDRWIYGITKNDISKLKDDNIYLAIVDFNGLKELNKYLDSIDIEHYSTYIDASYQNRLVRSLTREGNMTNKQVQEVVRRFNDDIKNVDIAIEYVDIVLNNDTKEDLTRNINWFINFKNRLEENFDSRREL